MISIYKHILENGYIGIGVEKKISEVCVSTLLLAYHNMDLMYRLVLALSIFIYAFVLFSTRLLTFGIVSPGSIFKFFSQIVPFSFAIRWARSFVLMREGEFRSEQNDN